MAAFKDMTKEQQEAYLKAIESTSPIHTLPATNTQTIKSVKPAPLTEEEKAAIREKKRKERLAARLEEIEIIDALKAKLKAKAKAQAQAEKEAKDNEENAKYLDMNYYAKYEEDFKKLSAIDQIRAKLELHNKQEGTIKVDIDSMDLSRLVRGSDEDIH